MKDFEEYVALARQAHGHICAGQILGLRMALCGLRLLGIEEPTGQDRKRLVTFIEIDRCATDAIAVVTGCRLGRRTLKFRDFGKVAATFCDLERDRAVRLVACGSARERARQLHPEIADHKAQQMQAYREMSDEDLFEVEWVRVHLAPEDRPASAVERTVCASCGEEINFKRELVSQGRTLCRACAGQRYYEPV